MMKRVSCSTAMTVLLRIVSNKSRLTELPGLYHQINNKVTLAVSGETDRKIIYRNSIRSFMFAENKINAFAALTVTSIKVLSLIISHADISGKAELSAEELVALGISKDIVNATRMIKTAIRLLKDIEFGTDDDTPEPMVIYHRQDGSGFTVWVSKAVFEAFTDQEITVPDSIYSLSDKAYLLALSVVSRCVQTKGLMQIKLDSDTVLLSLGINSATTNYTRDVINRVNSVVKKVNKVFRSLFSVKPEISDNRIAGITAKISKTFENSAFETGILSITGLGKYGCKAIESVGERIIREQTICLSLEKFGKISSVPIKPDIRYVSTKKTVCRCNLDFSEKHFFDKFISHLKITDDDKVIDFLDCIRSDLINRLLTDTIPAEIDHKALYDAKTKIIDHCYPLMIIDAILEYDERSSVKYQDAEMIYKRYGTDAIQALKSDPFTTAQGTSLSVETLEIIAEKNGADLASPARVSAYIRKAAEPDNGSTALLYQAFKNRFAKVFGAEFEEEYEDSFSAAGICKVKTEGQCYITKCDTYAAETELAATVKARCKAAVNSKKYAIPGWLNAEQKDALKAAVSPLYIITGGPGTGKTSVISALISAVSSTNANAKIVCCAPTGKAAKRLGEATGHPALTVDLYLLRKHPCDHLIVDEASMLSLAQARELFNTVGAETRITLVGDPDQLMSVGAGAVFRDMIQSGLIPMTVLKKQLRASEVSSIVTNAERIRKGIYDLKTDDHFKIVSTSEGEIEKHIKMKTKRFSDFQVLCPVKEDLGTIALNKLLGKLLCKGTQIKFGKKSFRIGEKVILNENNYCADYVNGDIGYITGCDDDAVRVTCGTKSVRVTDPKDIEPAYAITVHKSQGSEYDNVVIVLPDSDFTDRRLLYTAVTRARKTVTIIQVGDAISKACERSPERTTLLCEFLRAE